MKIRRLRAILPLVFLLSCSTAVAQEPSDLFEVPQDFDELDTDIKMPRTKKLTISMKDVPFYTKVFCSYLYEEKIKKWYQVLSGYLFVSKKKIKKTRHNF